MSDNNSKYQKLAAAIYLITSFFAEQEPLKWRLRSLAADLVSGKLSSAREILSLISLAEVSGLISGPNYSILSEQFSKIEEEKLAPLLETLPDPERRVSVIKDNFIEKSLERVEHREEEKPALKEFGAVSVKKNSRQSVIIGLLKRKKEVMIKDVSPLISGCSEKTIQRELSDMVNSGILRRIGEKRWTRYTLA